MSFVWRVYFNYFNKILKIRLKQILVKTSFRINLCSGVLTKQAAMSVSSSANQRLLCQFLRQRSIGCYVSFFVSEADDDLYLSQLCWKRYKSSSVFPFSLSFLAFPSAFRFQLSLQSFVFSFPFSLSFLAFVFSFPFYLSQQSFAGKGKKES